MAIRAENDKLSKLAESEQVIAPAFYPEKEAWKSKPGNRYTPEELEQMEERWEVSLVNPWRPTSQGRRI